MSIRYKVTTEIKTVWWKKILRCFRLYPRLKCFTLVLSEEFDGFNKGDILFGGAGKVKIIEKL